MEPIELLVGAFLFVIALIIIRLTFSVDAFLRYQRKQYLLSREIAKAMGVENEALKRIDPALFKKDQESNKS